VPLIAFLSLAFDLAITVCLYVYYTYGDERGGCKRNKTIISLNLVMSAIMIASGVISQASNTRGLLQPSVMSAYVGPPLFVNIMPALTLENDDASTPVCERRCVCEHCASAHAHVTCMSME